MGNICCSSSSATTTDVVVVGEEETQNENGGNNGNVIPTTKTTLYSGKIVGDDPNNNDDDTNTASNIRISAHTNDVEIHHNQIHRDSDATVYHDAIMDRFPSSIDMNYPPTNSMRQSMFLQNLDLDDMNMNDKVLLQGSNSSDEVPATTPIPTHLRQSVIQIKTNLQQEHSTDNLSGYPGVLTEDELEQCIEFREQLKIRDPAYKEMVLSMYPYEQEAFALCRFLRSRNFIIENVFDMLKEKNQAKNWYNVKNIMTTDEKQPNPFYKNLHNIDTFNNCPLSVFLTQYPMLHTGIGKNGAIIVYFKAGQVSVPGVECIVGDMVNALPFVWNQLYHETRHAMKRESEKHNNKSNNNSESTKSSTTTVLAEKIIIVDLKGDTTLFNEGIEFLKSVPIGASCFPESVNRTYVLNAPFSFRLIWAVISRTLETRTLQKIGFFSTIEKAKTDFLDHIESNELLSDYGGHDTHYSYNDIVAKRQSELSHKPGIVTRYIVELMCILTTGRGDSMDFDFNLQNNEKIDSIVIYSRSNHGCEFSITTTLSKDKNTYGDDDDDAIVCVDPIYVSREQATDNADSDVNVKPNYAIEIASSKDMLQQQQYTIHAKDGTAKDYFLIAISIAKVV